MEAVTNKQNKFNNGKVYHLYYSRLNYENLLQSSSALIIAEVVTLHCIFALMQNISSVV